MFLLQLPRLSQPSQSWRELRLCSGSGFGLQEHCGWFDLLSRHSKLPHGSNKTVLLSYHSCVYWSSTFTFFKNFSFGLMTWFFGSRGLAFGFSQLSTCLWIHDLVFWLKRPGFWLLSAFNMPSSLGLIISSFWFKVFTWTLRGHY